MISAAMRHAKLAGGATERFDEYRVVSAGTMTAVELRDYLTGLSNAVRSLLPSRDLCLAAVEHAGDVLPFDIASEVDCARLFAQLDCDDEEAYETSVDVTITKTMEQDVLSVYEVSALGNYLTTEPLKDVVRAFSYRFKGALCMECQGEAVTGGTRTIRFATKGETTPFDRVDAADRQQMLILFRESAHSDLKLEPLVPEDVELRDATGIDAIDRFIRRLSVLVSVSFLANHSWTENGRIHYRLMGYKVLEGASLHDDLLPASDALLRIARWCYVSGGQSDKVGLARNVMSIYLAQLSDLSRKPEVWHALQSNYQIYLKQNIESYLAVKGKLSDMLIDASARTQALAGTVLDALRNGIFVLLTFLLTVVVVNAFKDTSAEAVFSTPYLLIALITCLFLSVWVGAAAWHALSEYNTGTASLEQIINTNYGAMLSAEELNAALEPATRQNRTYLLRHARQHVITWLVIVVLLLCGLSIGHHLVKLVPISVKTAATGSTLKRSPEITTARSVHRPSASSVGNGHVSP